MSLANPLAFDRALRQAATEYLQIAFSRLAPRILTQIRDVVRTAVTTSPEAQSLLGGDLQVQFGIADPLPAVQGIIDAVVASVRVTILSPAGDSLGGLRVEILRSDMSEVINVPGGSYISRSATRKTEILVPWLNWLLLAGDRVIIADFETKTDRASYSGTRTGRAVMVRPGKRPSVGFRVPPHFSGVVDNNWLTRAVQNAVGPVVAILEQAMGSL